MARPVAVDVFPSITVHVGQLIRSYTHDWSILVVEALEVPMDVSTVHGNDVRKPKGSPGKGTRIASERVKKGIVKTIQNDALIALRLRPSTIR